MENERRSYSIAELSDELGLSIACVKGLIQTGKLPKAYTVTPAILAEIKAFYSLPRTHNYTQLDIAKACDITPRYASYLRRLQVFPLPAIIGRYSSVEFDRCCQLVRTHLQKPPAKDRTQTILYKALEQGYYNFKQAAKILDISYATLKNWVYSHRVIAPTVLFAGVRHYTKTDLEIIKKSDMYVNLMTRRTNGNV